MMILDLKTESHLMDPYRFKNSPLNFQSKIKQSHTRLLFLYTLILYTITFQIDGSKQEARHVRPMKFPCKLQIHQTLSTFLNLSLSDSHNSTRVYNQIPLNLSQPFFLRFSNPNFLG